MKIIDCHCHAGQGDGLSGPWDTTAPLSRFLRRSADAGIGQTVLFAAFNSDYARANAEVASIVARAPQRFKGFAFIHPEVDKGHVLPIVRNAVYTYGFCGIKVHRHDAHITREICAAALKFGLPVLYDVMGAVETVELFASEYPKLNFIIPHLGSFADDWKAQLNFIPILERHPNVFTDTSGVKRFDLLEMAVKRAGAHKVLFGTDGPWTHPGVELEKVHALELPPAEAQLILSGNLTRLLQNQMRPNQVVI
jgi:hypothetical protein